MPERPAPALRCSDAARERQDPLVGTAPPQRRLLLVEQEGGWGPDALTSLAVADDVREELRQRADATATRVMLIRRPGRQTSSVCLMRSWCLVDPDAPEGHRVTWGTWAYPSELLAAVDRAEELVAWQRRGGLSQQGEASGGTPSGGTPPGADEPVLLVCTNGRKDVCCAVRGRPVAAALAARWPEQTWECTHTGGDRFAANLLVLPDGATYGGLDPEDVVGLVERHRAGHPDATHLRGRIGLPRVVQAALVAAHAGLDLPWGDVRPGGAPVGVPLDDDRVVDDPAGRPAPVACWVVALETTDGRRLEAVVSEHMRPAARLTCSSLTPSPSRVPVVESLTTMPG